MAKSLFHLKEEIEKDPALVKMLDYSRNFEELADRYTSENFLVADPAMDVPFFAVTRDYHGAYEADDPESKWIVKKVLKTEEAQFRLGMVAYFTNYLTGNTCAPTILTRVDGEVFRASKLMARTEQLSGAPYLEDKRMRAQLAKDLINSWIFFDEDRNPNNYLIYYTPTNFPVVIAIDYSNIDLTSEEMKIKGLNDTFGWERSGKTRYMTPLKTEILYHFSWEFFKERFDAFSVLNEEVFEVLFAGIYRQGPASERKKMQALVAKNLIKRRDYVFSYFKDWFDNPEKLQKLQQRSIEEMHDEYSIMGQTFLGLQKNYENE